MDLDVFKLFAKRVAVSTVKLVLFIAAFFGAGFLADYLFVDEECAFLIGVGAFATLMMIVISLKLAWDIAKVDVEYKRQWGDDL